VALTCRDTIVHFPSYDGDVLVREVDADYVVWEVHGRTDFQYTATASQVSLGLKTIMQ
jgi:hypothetical protein